VEYLVTIATGFVLFSIQALGLNVQWGWAGLLNLSYIGWVAIGGYVAAFLTTPAADPQVEQHWLGLSQPFIVGALGAMLVCGLLSLAVGWVALRRLRSDYFAIVTLGMFTIFAVWASAYVPFANGTTGIEDVPQPFADQIPPNFYNDFFLALVLVVLIIVYFVCRRLQKSPFGRTLRAVREDQTAASAFGRNILWFKLRAFVIGSMIAGLGGALVAAWVGSYSPASWTAPETLILLTAVMLGGTANNNGVLLGGLLVNALFTWVAAYIPELPARPDVLQNGRLIIYGIAVLIVLYVRPQGIIPEPRDKDRGDVVRTTSRESPAPDAAAA
jgi:ABC-type branched-subunit amino acid transport system permease subunit